MSRKCARPDDDLSALEGLLEAAELVIHSLGPLSGLGGVAASSQCSTG